MSPEDTSAELRRRAQALGFHRVRVATLGVQGPGIEDYDRFLAEGRHGEMVYLARGRDARADPRQLLPGARSALVLGIDHGWPRPLDPGGLTGKVARYAWGRDYHNLVGKRLARYVRDLRAMGLGVYGGVDSRPLLERAWAEQSGLAYIGRNCMAIVPGQTSYLFLAVVLVDVELPPDPPIADLSRHCGRCTRCLTACPTQAFTASGELDARRCISYFTIEHRGPIPLPFREKLGRWVFGCDDCQDVCPHNPAQLESPELDFAPRPGHAWLDLPWLLTSEDDVIDARFVGSPLRRPKPWGLKRNAAVVLGNLGDRAAVPALEQALVHPHVVVQEAARWALDRL